MKNLIVFEKVVRNHFSMFNFEVLQFYYSPLAIKILCVKQNHYWTIESQIDNKKETCLLDSFFQLVKNLKRLNQCQN